MGNFTKDFTKVYEFDGDTVSVTMSRLLRKDAMKLTPYVHTDENGNTVMSMDDQMEMLNLVTELFPIYITKLSGLVVEGEELIIEDRKSNNELLYGLFLEQVYFLNLHSMIVADLMSESFVSSDDEKK